MMNPTQLIMMHTCVVCNGNGTIVLNDPDIGEIECVNCAGTGEVERSVESLMEKACRLDDEIKARLAEYVSPLQEQLDVLKTIIHSAVVAGGETVKTQYGRIEYVRAGERVTWNDAALLGFAVAHPEILQMRTAKETQPTTRIKFEVKP